jgi:hypothetical protein
MEKEMSDKLGRQWKPYGWLYTQGQRYSVLKPEPVAKDSSWNDGTYTFLVALETKSGYAATHLVTNAFAMELRDDLPAIEVDNTAEDVTIPVEEDFIPLDLFLEFEEPVLDDRLFLTDEMAPEEGQNE